MLYNGTSIIGTLGVPTISCNLWKRANYGNLDKIQSVITFAADGVQHKKFTGTIYKRSTSYTIRNIRPRCQCAFVTGV